MRILTESLPLRYYAITVSPVVSLHIYVDFAVLTYVPIHILFNVFLDFQKYRCSLKSLLQQGISQVFYGDLIYKLKKIKGNVNFSQLFVNTICRFKKGTPTVHV
jgi:hypothetical protein